VSVARVSGTRRAALAQSAASVERGTLVRAAVIGVLLLLALLVLPEFLGTDWIKTFTSVAIYSVVAAGLVILYGRVGMISLGQIAVLALGTWIGARLAYATAIPFPLLLVITGVITGLIGVLIGLPALRLSGLYLALITLMAAGAVNVALLGTNFPNGGGGFTGRIGGVDILGIRPVRRPDMAVSDTAYFRYTVIVCLLMFLLALWHISGKPGRAWASIRESEPAALAAGINITVYKLWAFGLASFMAGVAGCLYAANSGQPSIYGFRVDDSLQLLATTLMGGIFSLWGAVVSGMFVQLFPFLFQTQWGVNANFLLIIFGVGILQVLLTAPGGLVDQFPKDMAKLGRLLARLTRRAIGARGGAAA
jgi:branched-chain amino acid transport system permease protein